MRSDRSSLVIVFAALLVTLAAFEIIDLVTEPLIRYGLALVGATRFAPSHNMTELAALATRGSLASAAVFALLLAWSHRESLSRKGSAIFLGAAWGATLAPAHWLAQRLYQNFTEPHFFDFICCFFLSGKVAAQGLDFYDPANHHAIFANLQLPFTPGPDFFEADRGDLDSGFLYPPPTMLYFASLGHFDWHTAQLIWSAVCVVMLVLDIVLLRRIFFPAGGAASWPLAASVLLLCPATYRAVFFLQTTFIVLFLLLLFWRARSPRGAAWGAVAMFTKPFMGILAVWLLLRRQWRGLFGFAIAAAAICIVTMVSFGPAIFQSYLTNNSVPRLHNVVYIESPNQSLLATILRLTHYDFSYASPLMHPVFLVTASLLGLTTFFLTYRAAEQASRLTLALMVVFALLVYPATWNHLSLLLVPALLLMYTMRQRPMAASWLLPAFFAAVYAIMQVSSFSANLLVWAALAFLCARQLTSTRNASEREA